MKIILVIIFIFLAVGCSEKEIKPKDLIGIWDLQFEGKDNPYKLSLNFIDTLHVIPNSSEITKQDTVTYYLDTRSVPSKIIFKKVFADRIIENYHLIKLEGNILKMQGDDSINRKMEWINDDTIMMTEVFLKRK